MKLNVSGDASSCTLSVVTNSTSTQMDFTVGEEVMRHTLRQVLKTGETIAEVERTPEGLRVHDHNGWLDIPWQVAAAEVV
jgi:hypothetical protein